MGFIHRDIKPENFMMGLEKDRQGCLHLIDFGLAKRYLEKDGSHIKIGMFCSYKFLAFFINLIRFKENSNIQLQF